MDFIYDDYCQEGSNLEEFKKAAVAIDEGTTIVPMNIADIKVMSIFNAKRKEREFWCHALAPGEYSISPKTGNLETTTAKFTISKRLPEKLFDEAIEKETFFFHENVTYFLGDTLYKTLSGLQTGLGGKFLKSPGIERNLALVRQAELDPIDMNVVVRTAKGYHKIVSAFKGRFKRIPFKNLYSEAKKTGLSCRFWKLSNQKAEIYLEYDEDYNGIIPGIYFELSDTSYASAGISAVWRHGNTWYLQEKIKYPNGDVSGTQDMVKELYEKQQAFGEMFRNLIAQHGNDPVNLRHLTNKGRIGAALGERAKVALTAEMREKNFSVSEAVDYLLDLPETGCPGIKFTNNQTSLYHDVLKNIVENADFMY